MEIKEFIELVFDRASKSSLEEYEVYYSSSQSSSLKVFKGEVETYSDSAAQGVSLRGRYRGKMGYAYTEALNEKAVEFLVEEVMENSQIIESPEEEEIFGEQVRYTPVNTFNSDLERDRVEDEIAFLLNLERYALESDPRIKNVNYCLYGNGSSERTIKNSKGIDLTEKSNSAYCYISVVAEENGTIKSGSAFRVVKSLEKLCYKDIADEAVKKAVDKLPVDFIASQKVRAVIDREAFSSLLGAMSGIFSAENVQKGVSKLKNRLGEKVASERITLVDNPLLEEGYGSSSFDAEGVPTQYKEIIKDGKLITYLYNLKTAKKDGVESTGNAAKGGYKGTMGISPFNLYIKAGERTQEALLKDLGEGVLITGFTGLHSGLNSISGDFSLAGEGFLVKGGKRGAPLNQVIFSGNFYDLLLDVEEVGNDFKFDLSGVGSPSLRIKEIDIGA